MSVSREREIPPNVANPIAVLVYHLAQRWLDPRAEGRLVVADLVDDVECLQCLTDLRHAAPKAWMLVVTDDPPERGFEIVRECGADELMVTPFSVAMLIQYLATHIRLPRPLS